MPPLSLPTWDLSASYFIPGLQSSASWLHRDESGATSFSSRPLPSSLPALAHDTPLARRQARHPRMQSRDLPSSLQWEDETASSLLPACLSHSVVLGLLALLL